MLFSQYEINDCITETKHYSLVTVYSKIAEHCLNALCKFAISQVKQ